MTEFQIRVRENRRMQKQMWADLFGFIGGVVQVAFGFLFFFLMLIVAGIA